MCWGIGRLFLTHTLNINSTEMFKFDMEMWSLCKLVCKSCSSTLSSLELWQFDIFINNQAVSVYRFMWVNWTSMQIKYTYSWRLDSFVMLKYGELWIYTFWRIYGNLLKCQTWSLRCFTATETQCEESLTFYNHKDPNVSFNCF